MNRNGLIKKRKGLGSIIAGALLVMMMMSGYAISQLNSRAENNYQDIMKNVNVKDISKKQEQLTVLDYDPRKIGNKLTINIYLINNGPELTVLKYGSLLLDGVIISDKNYEVLFDKNGNEYIYLSPSEKTNVAITVSDSASKVYDVNDTYVMHIVTERGNVFSFSEFDIPNINLIMDELADVLGQFIPKYTSFAWGKLNSQSEMLDPPNWVGNFHLETNSSDKGYIFSVSGIWYWSEPITISERTCLKFEALDGPSVEKSCLIVRFIGNKAEPYTNFAPIQLAFMEEVTLYFAEAENGGLFDDLKSGSTYQVKLAFYDDTDYAQTFPLQVLVVD